MAEEDTKSDINESKEASEVSESENESKENESIEKESKEKENGDQTADGDESKENEGEDESKENEDDESKENKNKNGDVDESKENDGDESKENISDSENTPKKTVPLYDQPLETSGKRVRAKVEQYKVEQKEEHKYEFNGSGIALGEVPYIEEMINKELADDLKKLHSVCFGRPGDRLSVKKNLKQFNGYSFDINDQKYAAKKTHMEGSKIKKGDLSYICKILGLERSGTRPDLIDRVLEFAIKPEDHGKSVPAKKKRKSKSGRKKKTGAGKTKGSRKSKGGNEENDSTANDTADSSASESDDNENDSDSAGESDSEPEEKPKKTPAKKPGKTPAKKVSTKTPAKKTPAKKTPAKKTPAKKAPAKKTPAKRSKEEVDSDSDSSDDEPLIKKTKAAPSNDEIKQKVEKILDGADLEEVTMKNVCKQIYDMYPDFDLTDRKSFIKDTVKSIIS